MYIKDGICYAGELVAGIKVESAKVCDKGMMLVTFSTGEQRIFDSSQLEGSAFAPLEQQKVFEDFAIRHGVLTWLDGAIDIAPETMYDMSLPYTSKHDSQLLPFA